MARKCSVCEHNQVKDIDRLLVNGTGLRKIAEQFSLSTTAVHRHKRHLNKTLIKASELKDITHADNLMEEISNLHARALNILKKTEETEDWRVATASIREARGCLELLARLAGELREEPSINIIFSPQWVEIRTSILQSLEAYPEAKLSVMRAIDKSTYG